MKWFGKIAFRNQNDRDEYGAWIDHPIEREYFGDIVRMSKRDIESTTGSVNGGIVMTNQLSVLADPYLMGCFQDILYVTFNGVKWKVTNVEVNYPRLILNFGSMYNEEEDHAFGG